ncbi:MAG: hypothetical protein COA60_003285 [Robiginitomaculum sp.]|nr:hypothetical protein [Robiginitomaculum sp.]
MRKQLTSLLAVVAISLIGVTASALASEIPPPTELKVTRDNYQRIVDHLVDSGYNRREIQRWINASVAAHYPPNDRVISSFRARAAEQQSSMRDGVRNDQRRDRADNRRDRADRQRTDRQRVDRSREHRVERAPNRVRPVRTGRPHRVQRPARGGG